MSQNEMKAESALPERARLMEGLGVSGGHDGLKAAAVFADFENKRSTHGVAGAGLIVRTRRSTDAKLRTKAVVTTD